MKSIKLLVLLLLLSTTSIAQRIDTSNATKTNPIIFVHGFFGGGVHGLHLGADINYQYKLSLFTIKASTSTQGENLHTPPPVTYSPEYDEFGALYGMRFIGSNKAVSISVGASYNKRRQLMITETTSLKTKNTYAGIPWEININWFNDDKSESIFFIPVHKPTAFGVGGGVKLFGNVSKYSYVGVGITFGFGMYKYYKN